MIKVIKIIKKYHFTEKQYFADKEFTTNSWLKDFRYCEFLHEQKILGKVLFIPSDEMVYGTAVDMLLSGEDINKKFFFGGAIKGNPAELKERLKKIRLEISDREKKEKKPTKALANDLEKTENNLKTLEESDGKTRMTEDKLQNVKDTYEEIKKQPLYKMFDNAQTQVALAYHLLVELDGEEQEIKVKGLIDKIDPKKKILEDDKTTGRLKYYEPVVWYDGQLAWYRWLAFIEHKELFECYLCAGDRNPAYKRSRFFKFRPSTLDQADMENEQTLIRMLKAKKSNLYMPIVHNSPEMRNERCIECRHYPNCPFSIQLDFEVV